VKSKEILGLVNVFLYLAHVIVFSILGYRQSKKGGLKSTVLIIVFLSVIFFVSLQIGGFLADLFLLSLEGKETTLNLKPVRDTMSLSIATLIELPLWFIFLKRGGMGKQKGNMDET